MPDKKQPKLELKEGNIKITGDRLVLGLDIDKSTDKSNIAIEKPVVELPFNEKVVEDLISSILLAANLSRKEIADMKTLKKLFNEHREAYRELKKESAEEK